MKIIFKLFGYALKSSTILMTLFFPKNKKYLFLIHNELCYRAMSPVMDSLASMSLPIFWTTFNKKTKKEIEKSLCNKKIKFINFHYSRVRVWSVLGLADHYTASNFSKKTVKILFPHGVDNNGVSEDAAGYLYSRKNIYHRGKLNYDIFLETGQYPKNRAINTDPELNGKIYVVGHLLYDLFLDNVKNKKAIRKELSIMADEFVVIIGGAYGSESLWNKYGQDIEKIVLQNKNKYRFLITAHPHVFIKDDCKQARNTIENLIKNGIDFLDGHENLMKGISVADFAISDYSSVTTLFLLSKIPVLYVPLRTGIINEYCLNWKIFKESPVICFDYQLDAQISNAIKNFPYNKAEILIDQLIDTVDAKEKIVKIFLDFR